MCQIFPKRVWYELHVLKMKIKIHEAPPPHVQSDVDINEGGNDSAKDANSPIRKDN